MGWSGSTFSRLHNWVSDANNGIDIEADRHDEEDDNFREGIETCLRKDGGNAITADIAMGSNKFTGVDNASARDEFAAAGQVQDQSFSWCGTAGGTADALTLTPSPAITAYAAGQSFVFVAASACTGATTLAVSGLTAQTVQRNGSALIANDIEAGKLYEVRYDGTQFQLTRLSQTRGLELLSDSGALSAATVVTFNTASHFDGTYRALVFELTSIVPATDNVQLGFQISVGGAFQTSYSGHRSQPTEAANTYAGAAFSLAARCDVADFVGSGVGEGLSGLVQLFDPSNSAIRKGITWDLWSHNSGSNMQHCTGAGAFDGSNGAIDGARFLCSSGTISSGRIRMFGIRA